MIEYSWLNIYAHSDLNALSNPLKAVFKQLKPCLNHGIHVLFEHGFHLKILKTGHRLFMWCQTTMQGRPGISILHLDFRWRQHHYISHGMTSKWEKNKMASSVVYSAVKATFSWFSRHLCQEFSWNHIKCKINNQTCLSQCIITFAGSLGRCLNTQPVVEMISLP